MVPVYDDLVRSHRSAKAELEQGIAALVVYFYWSVFERLEAHASA